MSNDRGFFSLFKRIPAKYYLIGGVALIALIPLNKILHKTIIVIDPGERGLIINLGRLQDEVLDEGIHFIFPLTTSVKKINIRIQKTEIESTARTKELQRIKTKTVFTWQIKPDQMKSIYQKIGDESALENTIIKPIFEDIVKASIPSRTLEEVLNNRDKLREEVVIKMKNRLTPYGIITNDIAFLNLTASDEFTKATEERQIAEQKAISARIVAQQQIQEAELNAIKAKKEAEAVVNKAKGEAQAQKLLQQSLTPGLLQKQAIDKWNGQLPTVTGGNNSLPFINITPQKSPTQ